MKFTLAWLKEHLETDADLTTLARTLTAIGLEVEDLQDRARIFAPFRAAKVLEAIPHPNADRLRQCRVLTDQGEVQVVCGAPNARTGMMAVFAPSGSVVPGTGLLLKPSKIRGVDSNGMLVSEREMGLSEEHDGIIELPEGVEIGTPFARLFGLEDPVITINLTPNRGDCAAIRGIARDLAAAGLGTLKPLPEVSAAARLEAGGPGTEPVLLADPEGCPAFAARLIRGVRNGQSPAWMQERLKAVGQRSISALVDVTNWFTLAYGRPLHVFDAAKLTGPLTVRRAAPGESFLALDGQMQVLQGGEVVVADQAGVQALAGIKGGMATGVTPETTEVLLEAALFNPRDVARAGRATGVHSDARYRFERGVDPAFLLPAVELATQMILDLCGGQATAAVLSGTIPDPRRPALLRPSRVRALGGVEVPAEEQIRILSRLGFAPEPGAEAIRVTIPSWRSDLAVANDPDPAPDARRFPGAWDQVALEAHLVEEVLRIHGFDQVPETQLLPDPDLPPALATPQALLQIRARRGLARAGLSEAVTWAFVSDAMAERFGQSDPGLRLLNPITAEMRVMRPSILPNLLQAAGRNQGRSQEVIALGEAGMIFAPGLKERQRPAAAGLRLGQRHRPGWQAPARAADVYDAKADALAVLAACEAPVEKLSIDPAGAPGWFHPGRWAALKLGQQVLGVFGEIHPDLAEALDLRGRPVAFELFLDLIPAPRRKSGAARPKLELSPFQPVRRDFAFLVPETLPAEQMLRAVAAADKGLIASVELFDRYQGQGVPSGQLSLAMTVTLQPKTATLTEAEIEAVAAKITAAAAALGGVLRG